MGQNNMDLILKQLANGKAISGISLIRIDGEVLSSYFEGIQGTVLNLLARESLSAKKRRGTLFPITGGLVLSVARYQKMWVGLGSVTDDVFLLLVARPKMSIFSFCAKFDDVSRRIKQRYLDLQK